MLESYFGISSSSENSPERKKRLLAVQAALEIAKASVSSSSACGGVKSEADLRSVTKQISGLADAIQEALEKG